MTGAALDEATAHANLRVMTISRAVDLWLGALRGQRHSVRTIDTYRRLLNKLADAYPFIDVDELTTEQLRRFLDAQSRKQNGDVKAAATIAQNVTIVNECFDWLKAEEVVTRNPTRRNDVRVLIRPRLLPADENDNVKTVSSEDVRRLLAAADRSADWSKRLAVYAGVYLGPRRSALAALRRGDYDKDERTLRFTEKGGRTIVKPVPSRLADMIDAADVDDVYPDADSYLIPSRAEQRRPGVRDSRVIWRLVLEVAADAGVDTHVHALRAAFAVFFLESKPGEIVALQKLMGHARIETTLVYLRRLNRRQAMETVRDLDWHSTGVAAHDNSEAARSRVQIAAKVLEASAATEKEGFEPSFPVKAHEHRAGTERGLVGALEDALTDTLERSHPEVSA